MADADDNTLGIYRGGALPPRPAIPKSHRVARGPEGGPHACPCCGYMTLPERGNYDYCPVCWWEDEGQDDPYAHEFWYGPNRTSLSVARANYLRIGACDEYSLPKVRPPRPDEMPG